MAQPRVAIPESFSKVYLHLPKALAGIAWVAQAVILAALTWFLFGETVIALGHVIGNGLTGSAAAWQAGFAAIALVLPFLLAGAAILLLGT